jgi:undecaprenyl diphosphate synthase
MDGNGRWAESQGLLRVEGHRVGVDVVKQMVQICLEKRIAVLSLFAFSCENWSRPSEEVNFLMELFMVAIERELTQLHEHGVCLRFIGDRSRLTSLLQVQMASAELLTVKNQALCLNIAVNYSGRWDVVQAVRTLAERVRDGQLSCSDIDEALFSDCLSTHALPDPDLLIRTSGEQRISNFFLWQLAYSELYFTEKYWPEFTADEFERAINAFSHRERRYGLISRQLSERPHV